jgi:hypothetical protein
MTDFLIVSHYTNWSVVLEKNWAENQPTATTPKSGSSGPASSTPFSFANETSKLSTSTSNESSNHQVEVKLNSKFDQFIGEYAIKLYQTASSLCNQYSQPPYMAISLCSQLIFYKHARAQDQEIQLCKCLIETVDLNPALLQSTLVLDALVELYVKCGTFRLSLNESSTFHAQLMSCLTECFQSMADHAGDHQNAKHLELLLDLIFVYFYYNRKVIVLFKFNRLIYRFTLKFF